MLWIWFIRYLFFLIMIYLISIRERYLVWAVMLYVFNILKLLITKEEGWNYIIFSYICSCSWVIELCRTNNLLTHLYRLSTYFYLHVFNILLLRQPCWFNLRIVLWLCWLWFIIEASSPWVDNILIKLSGDL